MLNLDVRDLEFWHKEAQKKEIAEHIKAIQAVRVGMGDQSYYTQVLEDLKMQIRFIDHGKENVIKSNWNELKKIGSK